LSAARSLWGGMLGSYGGLGPVQARVLAKLGDYAECDFATSIAERSPLGSRVIRIQPAPGPSGIPAVACQDLAQWLAKQPWTEATTARPTHVYIRVSTNALRSWVAASLVDSGPASPRERGRQAVVRLADSAVPPPRPLDLFREAVVGRAIAALLTLSGDEVVLDPVTPTRSDTAAQALRGMGSIVVHLDGASATGGADVVRASVGCVDVPHGPLRARHGGAVSADDLLDEIREGEAQRRGQDLSDLVQARSDEYAEALLAFILLRTERARHIQLDEGKLRVESAAFDSVLTARGIAGTFTGPLGISAATPAGAEGDERALRDLAIELDLLFPVAARAASGLEPALLTRYVRSLAAQALAARSHLPATDPLWPAIGRAIDLALAWIGIDLPAEMWKAMPAAPLAQVPSPSIP
jgi:hypothetical protein